MIDGGWILAQVRDKWFAMKRVGIGLDLYDPAGVSGETARWNPKQRMSKEEAMEMVDKLNRKGPMVRVDGRGNPV